MTCLLEWFKAAPANEDDMIDDDHPNALLYRTKNCPCCRAVVRSKPIQLYLIKSLASSLDKAKAPPGAARPSPPPDDEDPWAGIFRDPNLDAYWSTDDDEEDDEDDVKRMVSKIPDHHSLSPVKIPTHPGHCKANPYVG